MKKQVLEGSLALYTFSGDGVCRGFGLISFLSGQLLRTRYPTHLLWWDIRQLVSCLEVGWVTNISIQRNVSLPPGMYLLTFSQIISYSSRGR